MNQKKIIDNALERFKVAEKTDELTLEIYKEMCRCLELLRGIDIDLEYVNEAIRKVLLEETQ